MRGRLDYPDTPDLDNIYAFGDTLIDGSGNFEDHTHHIKWYSIKKVVSNNLFAEYLKFGCL